jgi:hypothetical protein
MSDQDQATALPSVVSLRGWRVGVTDYGTIEVFMTLADKQEARAWALWLADRNPGKQ